MLKNLSPLDKIELSQSQKFEFLIYDIINHPFLHYHPFLKTDEEVVSNAKERAQNFNTSPASFIEFLDQCCCICYIGSIKDEENPYTSDGEIVQYKTLPIKFYYKGGNSEISVNKSDFNPRRYLSVNGVVDHKLDSSLWQSCEAYTIITDKYVKTSSLVNGEAEIEKHQNQDALLAYSIPTISGYGSLRRAYRLYTICDNSPQIIREQILRTQQYILCSIINLPKSIVVQKDIFNQEIFDKYLPTFKQMYDLVCIEIKDRGIEPSVKSEYLPSILDNIDNYFSSQVEDRYFYKDANEEFEDSKTLDYNGLFAIRPIDFCPLSELVDRNGNTFEPRFRDSIENIQDADYLEIDYKQIYGESLILCCANDLTPEDHMRREYEKLEEEEDRDYYNNEYEHNFYFDDYTESPLVNHFYLGLINKYGQTVFELKSLSDFMTDQYTCKFGFKVYDNNYVIIYLTDSYDSEKKCYTKCGAIDIRCGQIVIPMIFTEETICKELSHIWGYKDNRYYNPGWEISFYDDNQYNFRGPIYKKESDILEQGKYAGYTIKDALYFYGKDFLHEFIFKDRIFIADTAFPENIAHFSSAQRSIKLYQDKHLHFFEITTIDDVISTSSAFAFRNGIIFGALYEHKTLQEAIEDCNGMFYIKHLVKEGILKISKDVIDDLMAENSEIYLPLKNAYEERIREQEDSAYEKWCNFYD